LDDLGGEEEYTSFPWAKYKFDTLEYSRVKCYNGCVRALADTIGRLSLAPVVTGDLSVLQ